MAGLDGLSIVFFDSLFVAQKTMQKQAFLSFFENWPESEMRLNQGAQTGWHLAVLDNSIDAETRLGYVRRPASRKGGAHA